MSRRLYDSHGNINEDGQMLCRMTRGALEGVIKDFLAEGYCGRDIEGVIGVETRVTMTRQLTVKLRRDSDGDS